MSKSEALAEARKRWGEAARVWRVYWGPTERAWRVGEKVHRQRIDHGEGLTFEAAFADADARGSK